VTARRTKKVASFAVCGVLLLHMDSAAVAAEGDYRR
jgi:hypothetical protein